MSLVDHAELELKLSGAGDDYDGMVGDAVLELIRVFSAQGHSGYSAHVVRSIFNELAQFNPLGPVTDDPEAWMNVSEYHGGDPAIWQCRRKGSCFSEDGGKTYYDIDEPRKRWRQWARKLKLPVSKFTIHTSEPHDGS